MTNQSTNNDSLTEHGQDNQLQHAPGPDSKSPSSQIVVNVRTDRKAALLMGHPSLNMHESETIEWKKSLAELSEGSIPLRLSSTSLAVTNFEPIP